MQGSTPAAADVPQNDCATAPTLTASATLALPKAARALTYTVMDAERAIVEARSCRDDDDDVSEADARGAAVALLKAAEETDGQLRRMHAALQRLEDGRPRHAGEMLQLRQDENGWRHLLDGEPVHAGDSLLLLTINGWLLVRYEWRFDPTSRPTAAFGLPCAWGDSEVLIRLPEDARLAWPARRR